MEQEERITIMRELGCSASLTGALRAKGYTVRYPVLSSCISEANKIASKMLQVPLASKLFDYEKIRIVNGVPMSLEHILIPLALVPGIEVVDLTDVSLYTFLSDNYGLIETHDEEEVLLVHASEREAELLDIAPDGEVMMIEGISSTASGMPFSYFQIIARPNFYQFRSDTYYE